MGFRDDRDAVAHRAVALERELGDANSELRNEKLRSAEVDDLRKRLTEATKERDDLRRGVAPWRTRTWLATAVLSTFLIGGGVFAYVHDRARDAQARLDHDEIERTIHQVGALRLQLEDARAATERAQAGWTAAEHTGRLQEERLFRAERAHADDVLIVAARSGAGQDCFVEIRPVDAASCDATVTCRGIVVFPVVGDPIRAVCRGADGAAWESVHAPLLDVTAGSSQTGLTVDATGISIRRNGTVEMVLTRLAAGALALH